MLRGRWIAALVVLCAASPAAAGDPLRAGETARDGDGAYPGLAADEARIWAVRIVDAATGRPIPSATVRVPNHREAGATAEDVFDLCAATTDQDGWARLPRGKMDGWKDYVVADASGYAPTEHCTPDQGRTECALVAGADVPFVLLDMTGRPVAGARVGLNLGCGHIADQRESVTDAKGAGVLRSVDPARHGASDLWIEASGLSRGATGLASSWRPGNAPVAVHASPGIVVEGTLLGRDGKPVKGAAVGAHDADRPWVRTGADGRFRLPGVAPWRTIDVHLTDDRAQLDASFVAPPQGTPRTLKLGEEPGSRAALVRVRGPAGEKAEGVRVVLVRPADGRTETIVTLADGDATFHVPGGRWDVVVDGELGVWGTAEATLGATDDSDSGITVTLARNPTVRVDASRVRDQRVLLATSRQIRVLETAEIDGKDVPVPAFGPATFRVSGSEDGETLVRYTDVPASGPARAQPLVLEWLPETRVTAQLTGPGGNPVPGSLRIVRRRGKPVFGKDKSAAAPSDAPTAVTRLAGTVDWIAEPADAELGAVSGTIVLPEPGGHADVGAVRFAPAAKPALAVEVPVELGAEGEMVHVGLSRVNYQSMSLLPPSGILPLHLPWMGADERVVLRLQDTAILPLLVRTAGPPPWRARWPAASLTIHAIDPDLDAVEPSVVIDGTLVVTSADETGGVTARGLAAGAHDVVVTVPGLRAKVLRLVMTEGEQRELDVALTRRK